MRDMYTGSEKEEENDAVARLLSDVGISVNMDYSMDGSSALINGNGSFVYFFKYSSDIHSVEKSEHTIDEWYDLIKSQIDEGWPVIPCIWKKDEGETKAHAVVFDGYRKHIEVNQVHVNMGWEGSYDNYYSLDDIADDEINILVYNLNVRLEAEKKEERAWIIKRQYGELGLLVNNLGSTPISKYLLYKSFRNGGESGIRTPGARKGTTVFKTAAFNRSANSP